MGYPRSEQFTTDGTATYVDLDGPIYPNSERVLLNGIIQPRDDSSYTLSNLNRKRVSFVVTPPAGTITVAYLEDSTEL